MHPASSQLNKIIETVKALRGENGCPWDAKQTPQSLKKYIEEEVGELLTAIDNDDHDNIREELGDVLFLLVIISEYFDEKELFSLTDVLATNNEKLIRRHPHVFAGVDISDEQELRQQWQRIKAQEKEKNKI